MEQCYKLPCPAPAIDFTGTTSCCSVSFLTLIVKDNDSQNKDFPLLLHFQFLPSYHPTPLSRSIRLIQCANETQKDEESSGAKTAFWTHLHSLISYLIGNLRTVYLISVFVISVVNQIIAMVTMQLIHYTHTSIFLQIFTISGKEYQQ